MEPNGIEHNRAEPNQTDPAALKPTESEQNPTGLSRVDTKRDAEFSRLAGGQVGHATAGTTLGK